MLNEGGDDLTENGTGGLETWICIDLDQPHLIIRVDHQVQSEDFKVVGPPLRVQVESRGVDGASSSSLHLWVDLPLKVETRITLLQISIQIFVCYLISLFETSIVGQCFLDSVIRQVHCSCSSTEGVFCTSGADVAVAVPVSLDTAVDAGEHDVVPQVELPTSVQQRTFNILLQDVSLVGAVTMLLLPPQDCFDIRKLQAHQDTVSPVGELTRLDNPCIVTMEGVLSGFILPSECVVMLQELEVLIILDAIFDVKGQGQVVEHPLSTARVVVGHCLEESLLIANEEVIAEVVVDVEGPHLSHRVFSYSEQLTSQLHALLYYALLIHVATPILLPFPVFTTIKQRKVLTILPIPLSLLASQWFTFLLSLEDGWKFDLCPYEIGILVSISELKPRTTLHDPFDQV